jgi:hypothetical protein
VNGYEIDFRWGYPLASTRHARIDDATEGKFEHHIPNAETSLRRLHEVEIAQTGLGQRMVVGEF